MLDSVLSVLTDAVDPSLAVLGLAVPWIEPAACVRQFGSRWRAWIPLAVGLAAVYLIQFIDNRLLIWPSVGMDYSTHTAFAVAIITLLIRINKRWLPGLLTVLVAYGVLMSYFHYHSFADMLTSALVVAPVPWLAARVLRLQSKSSTP